MMLLAIDIGNTSVSVGLFAGDRLEATWRFAPDVSRSADEYGILLMALMERSSFAAASVRDVVIGSVVHGLEGILEETCRRYFDVRALVVGAGVRTGLRILYDSPREVGVDRVADAVAAIKLYGPPLIVADLGTATVFDAITREGDYVGGAIAPGLMVGAEALFRRADRLHRVEMQPPPAVIGRNTEAALQAGIVYGHVSLLEGMVALFKAELGADAQVVATGGYAELLARLTKVIDHVNPDLTLRGLQIIYDLNRKRRE